LCFYVNPVPNNRNYAISPNGGTNSITFPNYGNTFVWSGNIGACTAETCERSADICYETGCSVINGAPQTRAEFTLPFKGADFYDVTVINGLNLGVSITPDTNNLSPSRPYDCGSAGGAKSTTGTSDCSWSFNPPDVHYNWVIPNGLRCTTNADCTTPGTVCGLSYNIGQSPIFSLSCGRRVGYWTDNQICGIDRLYGNCASPLPSPNSGNIVWNLMACNEGIPSCYQNGATTNCCGCQDWQNVIPGVPASTEKCISSNPNWFTYVYQGLLWMKQGCPTAYTYPYDDVSSTFVCSEFDANGINSLDYTIKWCPELESQFLPSSSSNSELEPEPESELAPSVPDVERSNNMVSSNIILYLGFIGGFVLSAYMTYSVLF